MFFSDRAMDIIVNDTNTKWTAYGRPTGSLITGKRYGEIFAHSFYPTDIDKHLEKLFYIVDLFNQKIIKRCIGWEHYRAMQGITGKEVRTHKIYNDFTVIDDWTEDFDHPEDFDSFLAHYNNRL